jgi:hypothetical protein
MQSLETTSCGKSRNFCKSPVQFLLNANLGNLFYADANTGGRIDFPELFIPGIGPFIAFARYDSYVVQDWPGRETEKALLAASGLIQSLSIVGIIYEFGLFERQIF